jgi:hypothetical protein
VNASADATPASIANIVHSHRMMRFPASGRYRFGSAQISHSNAPRRLMSSLSSLDVCFSFAATVAQQ